MESESTKKMETNFDIVVIGGGAAGLMAAIRSASAGRKVALLEKNDMCGRKILLTGKGRCNITNTKPKDEFMQHIHPDNRWFKNALYHFSNQDTVSFFNNIGVPTVEERGARVFPESAKSRDVAAALVAQANALGVEIFYRSEVSNITSLNGRFTVGVVMNGNGRSQPKAMAVFSRAVIIATGGLSYPQTGSTGDGYRFATSFGHTVNECFPSLTALMPERYSPDLCGILLKNVSLTLYIDGNQAQNEFGELQFTSGGIEGALGFRVSRRAVKALDHGSKVELLLDMKPAVSLKEFSERVAKDVSMSGVNTTYLLTKLLGGYMPSSLIKPFLEMNPGINSQNLAKRLKEWRFKVISYVGYERCVITAGGISLDEVSRKNMESKLIPGLFFAGEVLDLDGDTGGYNLQIAFSTGALAGDSAAKS